MTSAPFPADDEPGVRLARVEVEVTATPEQVWEAIATGPGIAAWFVPAEVDGREGGEIVTHHGAFGSSRGVVTAWEPPHRFAYEEREWSEADGAPPWATEILVEARAGGTCVVRLASGFLAGGEEWGDELGSTYDGWRQGMVNLRLYLTHFAGQPTTSMNVSHVTAGPAAAVRERLLDLLGLHDAAAGQRRRVPAAAAAPPLAGIVEDAPPDHLALRIDDPTGGHVVLSVHGRHDVPGAGGGHAEVVISLRCYLYGDAGPSVRARDEGAWETWLAERFPAPAAAG